MIVEAKNEWTSRLQEDTDIIIFPISQPKHIVYYLLLT